MNAPNHHTLQATANALRAAFTAHEQLARRAVGGADPWDESFILEVQEALAHALAPLRKQVCAALAGLDDIATLQQAWAVAAHKPLWAGLLYRAFVQRSDALAETPSPLVQEAQRLRALTEQRWKASIALSFEFRTSEFQIARLLLGLAARGEAPPDLGDHTRLDGRARLRYRLAHHFHQGASIGRLLALAAHQRAVRPSERRQETARALVRLEASGRRVRALGEREFVQLDEKERALVVALRPWWRVLLAQPLQAHRDLPRFAGELDRERARVLAALSSLMGAVRSRRFGEVDAIIRAIGNGPVARHLVRRLGQEPWGLHDDPMHASRRTDFGPWVPMPPDALATLQAWAPHHLPPWWAMTAWHFVQWLLAEGPEAPTPQLATQDLAPLQRSWTQAETLALIRAGHGRLAPDNSPAWEALTLEELARLGPRLFQRGRYQLDRRLRRLPDARPWLVLMARQRREDGSWDEAAARALRDLAQETLALYSRDRWASSWCAWVAPCIGTPEWHAVRKVAMERTSPVSDLSLPLGRNVALVDPPALRLAVAQSLHDPELLPSKPVRELLLWLKYDPEAAPVVVEHGPRKLVLKAASEPGPVAGLLRAALGAAP